MAKRLPLPRAQAPHKLPNVERDECLKHNVKGGMRLALFRARRDAVDAGRLVEYDVFFLCVGGTREIVVIECRGEGFDET